MHGSSSRRAERQHPRAIEGPLVRVNATLPPPTRPPTRSNPRAPNYLPKVGRATHAHARSRNGGEMVAVRAAVPSLRKGSSSAATIAQSRTSPPHLVCEKNLRDPSETLFSLSRDLSALCCCSPSDYNRPSTPPPGQDAEPGRRG